MGIRFQADADLRFAIVGAVRQREAAIDFASAADARLDRVSDPVILERAAQEERVLVSHDRRTMLHHFRQRLAAGKSSPGLLIASQGASTRLIAEAILLLWSVSDGSELRDQVLHLPKLTRHVFPR